MGEKGVKTGKEEGESRRKRGVGTGTGRKGGMETSREGGGDWERREWNGREAGEKWKRRR